VATAHITETCKRPKNNPEIVHDPRLGDDKVYSIKGLYENHIMEICMQYKD